MESLAAYGIGKVKKEGESQTSEKAVQYWEEPGILIKKSKNDNGEEVKETIIEGKLAQKEVTSKLHDSGYINFEYDAEGNLEYTKETDFCGNTVEISYDEQGNISEKSVTKNDGDRGFETETYDKNDKLVSSVIHNTTPDGYEEFHYNGQGELLSKNIMTETDNGEVNEKITEHYQKDEHSQELKLSGKEIETNYSDGKKVYISEGYKAPYLYNHKIVTTKNMQGGETTLYYNDNELMSKTETNADKTNIKKETYIFNGKQINGKEEYLEDGTHIDTEYKVDSKGMSVPSVSYTHMPNGKTITEQFDKNGKKKKDKIVKYEESGSQINEFYDINGKLKTKKITTKNGVRIKEEYNPNGEMKGKKISN